MNKKIGQLLKEARKNCGMTQVEVAQMLDVSDGTVSNWEKAAAEPDIDTFVEVCKIYGVNPADVLTEVYGDPTPAKQAIECTIEEIELVEKFRTLGRESKDFILMLLEREYQREVPIAKKKSSFKAG